MDDTTPKTTAAKAWVGGAIATALAFLGALSVAIEDNTVTGQEWVVITIATLTSLGAVTGGVYATTNRPK